MPFVKEVEEAQADPQLREMYSKIEQGLGFLPHYFKTLGAMPAVIQAQLAMNDAIMQDGALTLVVKEQIGLVVSGINSSAYCIMFHMELLRRFGVEKTLARKLSSDYENAAVEPKVKVLFRFADKLTRHPDDIEESDTDELKKSGWSDDVVRETVLTVAYFNYINRVSLGLGLFAALLNQLRHQRGPAGLVAGPQTKSVISIEIFVKQNQVTPEGIFLEQRLVSVHRPPPVGA